jgi:hypothetical protein
MGMMIAGFAPAVKFNGFFLCEGKFFSARKEFSIHFLPLDRLARMESCLFLAKMFGSKRDCRQMAFFRT